MSERETAQKEHADPDMGHGWFVTAGRWGDALVTIEEKCLSGKPEFTPEDEALIRGAALHLLAFIGADPVPVCQWREIATAPKDGTRVLVMWEYWSADPFVAYFKHGRWNGEVALSECSDDGPTHWMPLPAPPVALVPAEGDR
jgi:hypothetical protein